MTWKRSESRECRTLTNSEKIEHNSRCAMKTLPRTTKPVKRLPRVPHVFEPVDRQQVGGHGKVQLVDESGHLGRRIQQVDDGAAQVVKLGLKPGEQTISCGRSDTSADRRASQLAS